MTWRAQRQRKQCQAQLVDTVHMMTHALQASLTLPQAMTVVADQAAMPIRDEYARLLANMDVGMSLTEAFAIFAQRIGGRDVRTLQFAINVLSAGGGDLVASFTQLSAMIAGRARVRQHIQTMTMQGTLTGVIVACIPIVVLIGMYVLMPQYVVPLFTTVPGVVCGLCALACEVGGLFWIRRIIRIPI
jgi:tight adherence protein B